MYQNYPLALICQVCGLAFQSGEKKHGSLLYSSIAKVIWDLEFPLENAWFIGGSGSKEGHIES